MKILYLIPSLRPHGGIRVLVEHCNYMATFGHDVTMQNFGEGLTRPWLKIRPEVTQISGGNITDDYDVIVASTPPLALKLDQAKVSAKKFYFLQMAEHLFSKANKAYNQACYQSYKVKYPIIGISRWVEYVIREGWRGGLPMHYVGNGVAEDFWYNGEKPDELTVLVEGWETYGDAKDVSRMSPKIAKRLKEDYGAKIIAYSQFPLTYMKDVPDEYYQVPTAEKLIEINKRAHIMLKASMYDARSCAPVEALASGAIPVRAIMHGDDDLIHGVNCLRSAYGSEEAYYRNAVRAIMDGDLQRRIKDMQFVESYHNLNWDRHINNILDIFHNS
jgi:glycosyltransferase involved in cell wall biosynthesis